MLDQVDLIPNEYSPSDVDDDGGLSVTIILSLLLPCSVTLSPASVWHDMDIYWKNSTGCLHTMSSDIFNNY